MCPRCINGNETLRKMPELQLFCKLYGSIRTSQAVEAGIVKPTFYLYIKEKGLERMAHGIYVSPDAWADVMYVLHLRCEQAIFSHDSALFFHELTDREPMRHTITVKTGYNPMKLNADGIQVYTVKKELHEAEYPGIRVSTKVVYCMLPWF